MKLLESARRIINRLELRDVEDIGCPSQDAYDVAKVILDIADAFTNRFHDGTWAWWNSKPSCGAETMRATKEEAVADLVEFAEKMAKQQRNKHSALPRLPLLGS